MKLNLQEKQQQPLQEDLSFGDYALDAFAAPFRGIESLARGVYNLGDFLSFDLLPDLDEERLLGESKTLPGTLIEGIAQFALPFGVIGKGISVAGKAAKAGKITGISGKAAKALTKQGPKAGAFTDLSWKGYAAASATTDFIAFDGQEERLSNLIRQHTDLRDPVTEFLAADPDDNELEGRAKNVLEGVLLELGVGALVAPFVAGLRAIKRKNKILAEGGQQEEAIQKSTEQFTKEIKEQVKPVELAKPKAEPKPTKQEKVRLQTEAKVFSDDKLFTGGLQSLQRTASGRMLKTITDEAGNKKKVFVPTIEGGLRQSELNTSLEKSGETLIKEGKKQFVSEGKMNQIAIEEMADATGADGNTLEGLLRATESDPVALDRAAGKMLALRRFMTENGIQLVELSEQYAKKKKGGLEDELLEAQIKSALDVQLNLQARVSEIASGFGRGLRSTQFKAKIGLSQKEIQNTKLRQEYLRRRGGMKIDDIVNSIRLSKEGAGDDFWNAITAINKQVRGSNGGKLTKMVREYYINSLLWGPRTNVVNVIGNSISATIKQFERYIGGWLTAEPEVRRGVVSAWSYGHLSGELWQIMGKAWKAKDGLLDTNTGWRGDVGNEAAVDAISGENFASALRELRGDPDILKEADGIKTAIDYFGNILRLPTRLMTSMDSMYKDLEFRRRAMAQLWIEATEKKGLTQPEDIAKFISNGIETLVTTSGRHFSEASLLRDAEDAAKKLDFADDRVAREEFMFNHVEQARADNLKRARDLGLAGDDEGALARFAEQWVEPNLRSAHESTFTTELGPISQKLNDFMSSVPLGWIVLPFIKTPTNILKFSFGRLFRPFQVGAEAVAKASFPGLTANRDLFIKKLEDPDPLIRAEARGQLAMGTLLAATVGTTIAANKHRITGGGPLNARQKRVWEAAGNRPYSIKVGDTWISYQRLDPLATIVGVFADMATVTDDTVHGYDASEAERVVAAIGITFARNVTNKSYLAGINKFIEALVVPEKKLAQALQSTAAAFVPNVFYQGQSVGGDQELREVRTLADAVFKKVGFGLQDRVDVRRNILGEPYEAEGIEAPPFQILNPFNPIAFSTKTDDPVLVEMANLHHGFSPPSSKLNQLVDLTRYTGDDGRTAYDRWMELHSEIKVDGKSLRQTLEKLIKSKEYRSLDPSSINGLTSPRVPLISRVLSNFRSKALEQMLREFPEVKRMYDKTIEAKTASKQGASYEDVLELLAQ
jgi:hypothetical protein